MRKRARTLILIMVLVAMTSAAIAQESLKDVVEEQGFAWMIGKWKATTDSGQEIVLTYAWAVKGHAIVTTFKMGDRSSQGMIYFDADQEQVRQFSIDSLGNATKGTWEPQGNKAVLKSTWFDEYGDETAYGLTYEKVDNNTIKAAVYALENGELSYDPWFEINYTRQKK